MVGDDPVRAVGDGVEADVGPESLDADETMREVVVWRLIAALNDCRLLFSKDEVLKVVRENL